MSLISNLKLDAGDAVLFLEKLLPKLEGTPAVQHAELTALEMAKGALEAAAAPYAGALDPEVNMALDALFKLVESKLAGLAPKA